VRTGPDRFGLSSYETRAGLVGGSACAAGVCVRAHVNAVSAQHLSGRARGGGVRTLSDEHLHERAGGGGMCAVPRGSLQRRRKPQLHCLPGRRGPLPVELGAQHALYGSVLYGRVRRAAELRLCGLPTRAAQPLPHVDCAGHAARARGGRPCRRRDFPALLFCLHGEDLVRVVSRGDGIGLRARAHGDARVGADQAPARREPRVVCGGHVRGRCGDGRGQVGSPSDPSREYIYIYIYIYNLVAATLRNGSGNRIILLSAKTNPSVGIRRKMHKRPVNKPVGALIHDYQGEGAN